MDEHKNFKEAKKRPSVDGIISGGRPLGQPISRAYQADREHSIPTLDTIARSTEGFHPARVSRQGIGLSPEIEEAALLDEPIVLDESTIPRKKRYFGHKRPRLYKTLKRASLVLAGLVLIGAAYFGVKLYITKNHLFHGGGRAPALAANIDINQLKGEGDGRINILLLGKGGPGHDGADLTDSILLASIDPVNNKMALLSLPRDLWVKIPGDGYQKINAAYAYGKEASKKSSNSGQEQDGLSLLDQALEPIIGIPIHYHVVMDFKAFQQAVTAVGGVDVNVPPSLTAYENFWVEGTNQHYQLSVSTGQQHFDGTKALYYARERHNDSDFARAQRQRLLLAALKDKVLSAGTFSNPVRISNLLSSLGNNVYTDFSLNDTTRLYQIIQKIPSNDIASLDLVTAPHDFLTTGNINGLSVVEPKTGLFDYTAIQGYVRNALRDSFLAKENSNLAIYNATSIDGLASSKATLLKSFGYTVNTIANSPKTTNPATTTVVDLTKGQAKYTKHYLEERFGVTAVTDVPTNIGVTPPAGTDFVIILGRDAANSG